MPMLDRNISSFELKLSTESKLHSSKLVESKSINKTYKRRNEKRYLLNTDYINNDLEVSNANLENSTKRRKGHTKVNDTICDNLYFNKGLEFKKSPIRTNQGYYLYLHYIIENNLERDIFTVGDHVMICLSDGGERPAQITAFLYDAEKDLQGVEVRWFYSEDDILKLGKIIDKTKLPEDLFSYEEEFLESDKCEVLEVNVIKRMIRIWNIKDEYLKWTKDQLEIYSGPQNYVKVNRKNRTSKKYKDPFHDELLAEYIKEFNEDLPPFAVELCDNYLSLYIVLISTGTIVPISKRRDTSYLLSRCSNYYSYYVNYLSIRSSIERNIDKINIRNFKLSDLHWSKRPKNILPCREKEHREITQILKTSIMNDGGGVLFIAGLPGTGKTATVLNTLNILEDEINLSKNVDKKIVVCYINSLHLSTPDHFYKVFLQELNGSNTWSPNKEACYSSLDHFFKAKNSPITILVIDEIDWLQKNVYSNSENMNSTLLYTLIDWPFQKNTKLIIIAIANTMDLPEKLIPRCTSRCGYARINFTPFNVDNMITILTERIKFFDENSIFNELNDITEDSKKLSGKNENKKNEDIENENSLFCNKAIEFCARRIAQQSSDVRRALQVLQRSWEICKYEYENKLRKIGKNSKVKIQVQITHVQTACKEVLLNNSSLVLIENLPLIYKLFLASLLLELEFKNKNDNDEENFQEVFEKSVSLFSVEKRLRTVLSLIGYFNQDYIDNSILKMITRKLIYSRIIQTHKGMDCSKKDFDNCIESINCFGTDIWVSILVDTLTLKNFLIKNLHYKIPGLE